MNDRTSSNSCNVHCEPVTNYAKRSNGIQLASSFKNGSKVHEQRQQPLSCAPPFFFFVRPVSLRNMGNSEQPKRGTHRTINATPNRTMPLVGASLHRAWMQRMLSSSVLSFSASVPSLFLFFTFCNYFRRILRSSFNFLHVFLIVQLR